MNPGPIVDAFLGGVAVGLAGFFVALVPVAAGVILRRMTGA